MRNPGELIHTVNSFNIDVKSAFKKITSFQFPGNPGRSFGEILMNAIDSFPVRTTLEKRRCVITTTENSISLADFGIGMNLTRLHLLLTLGGTDKEGQPDKIGRFGIGFFSMLNPRLETETIEIITRCEGEWVRVVIRNKDGDSLPSVNCSVIKAVHEYSTRITARFHRQKSVNECLKYATSILDYIPVNASINGEKHPSVWAEAERRGWKIFINEMSRGFVFPDDLGSKITVLSRHEFIGKREIFSFSKGGYNLTNDLDDFLEYEIPYLPGFSAICNNDQLSVTISRDGYYLNSAFYKMVDLLRSMLMEKLLFQLSKRKVQEEVILANIFILKRKIGKVLHNRILTNKRLSTEEQVLNILMNEKVFQAADQREKWSLVDIDRKLSAELPLFYCNDNGYVYWLGGGYKHDFVLLTSSCRPDFNGAKDFFKRLYTTLFIDVVELDSILEDAAGLKKLVSRNIVTPEDLQPKCNLVAELDLDSAQRKLLVEINELLCYPTVKQVISRNLKVYLHSIIACFFTIDNGCAWISTGLLDSHGNPFSTDSVTHLFDYQNETHKEIKPVNLILGLRLDHAIINVILESNDKYRSNYLLSYLVQELSKTQRLLLPSNVKRSGFKEKFSMDLRRALQDRLLDIAI